MFNKLINYPGNIFMSLSEHFQVIRIVSDIATSKSFDLLQPQDKTQKVSLQFYHKIMFSQ